jgi:MFS family permease
MDVFPLRGGASALFDELRSFFSRQARNYRLVLLKKSGYSAFNYLTLDYTSIYIRLLGASFVQLGLVGSIGWLVNAVVAYPFGRLIDEYSSRRLMLFTVLVQALVPLTYFLARDWVWIAVATSLSSLAYFFSQGLENVVMANSLRDEERAKGFTLVMSVSMVPTVVAPLVAAAILTRLGGISAGSLKTLFLIEFLGLAVIGLYIVLRFEETGSLKGSGGGPLLEGLREVISGSPYLKRWLLIDTISASSYAVMGRYVMVYAQEVKGVDPVVIGSMGAVFAVVGILSSVPIGALADRIGRIKTVVLTRPLFHASTLILLFTPDPRLLVLGWALRGTFNPSLSVLAAYRNELVSPAERGRWMGVRELLRRVFMIPAPLLGGVLYTSVSPRAPFLFHMFMDVFVRVPLLLTMPRTLPERG